MTINESNKFIERLKDKDILILAALKQETGNIKGIIHTGLGKINAAIKTTETILKYRPKIIINYGTCGSVNKKLSGLISCTKFIQHDIDCSPLGFEKGLTPFDKVNDIKFSETGFICASGDIFVTYSIAKACKSMNIDFKCYKYITDSADGSASLEWAENCSNGIDLFMREIIENEPN